MSDILTNVPPTYDIVVSKGSDMIFSLFWKDDQGNPIDLTGYQARMQMKLSYNTNNYIFTATTVNNLITFNALAGEVIIKMPNSDTKDWVFSRAFYDIEMIAPTSEVYKIAKGTVTLDAEVTT